MLAGETVVAQVDHGAAPPNWQITRGRPAFHLQQIILGVVVVAIGVVGAVFLLANPDQAFSYGAGGEASMSVINGWRTVDFVVLAIFALAGAYLIVQHTGSYASAKSDLLVMVPEGFVIRTGRRIQTYDFATLTSLRATLSRGTLIVNATQASGAKLRSSIDGRFGKVKPIGQAILAAYSQYRAATVRPQG